MRDFPSCFGENAVQISDSSSSNGNKTAQNLVTCVYQCLFRGRSCHITITWSKNLMGQGLSVGIDDSSSQCLCKVDINPWLFSKRKGSKTLLEVESSNIDMHWDLLSAKFGSGPEPLEGFYLAILCDKQIVLLLGDMKKEALKKTNSTLISNSTLFVAKKEHVYGKKVSNETCLIVRVDTKNVMQIRRLRWKFRVNHTLLIDGLPVEVFWDVHNWLFSSSPGSAVFMFRTSLSPEKILTSQPICDPSVLHWSNSQRFRDSQSNQFGFALIMYAWKQE